MGGPGMTVGVLSDTHGHLYPEVQRALADVDHIIHAGDIGSPAVLDALRGMAPVTAVRGNCDYEAWAQALPLHAEIELAGVRILVGHVAARLRSHLDTGRLDAVITGHTHLASMEMREGTLYLNPGSAGPQRFGRSRTIARITIGCAGAGTSGTRSRLKAEIIDIES